MLPVLNRVSSLGCSKSGLLRVEMEGGERKREKEEGRPAGGLYTLREELE